MTRSTLDKLLSSTGLIVAVVLLAASGGLFYAHRFVRSQVHDQLTAQRITFPAADSAALHALPPADHDAVAAYAGQQVITGAQAKVFADNYIAAHLKALSNDRTYAELSAASRANPSDAELTAKVDSVFRGETLRGLLLNAYAFDTMATVAKFAALGSLLAAIVLGMLSLLGFRHAKTTNKRR